jgi:hypothetical protein
LVWVLAIAKYVGAVPEGASHGRPAAVVGGRVAGREPGGDGDVVPGGVRVGLAGQAAALVEGEAASAASASGYLAGSVITATLAWFFAAARTIAGPPMSICSTHSSGAAPDWTVDSNGYRFDTSNWNGSMSRFSS